MQQSTGILDSFDADTLHFFSCAALFRDRFSIDWLVNILGKKASEVLSLLEDGVQKRWLARKKGGIFYFINPEIREELENRLSPREKERLHKRIVEVLIKETTTTCCETALLVLSHHIQQIKSNGKLCKLLLESGNICMKSFHLEDALKCYFKILHDLSGVETTESDDLFIKAAIQSSKATTAPQHNCLNISPFLEEALMRASRERQDNYRALLYMHLAKNEWLSSQYKKALEHFDQGWSLAEKLGSSTTLRSAHTLAIYFSFWKGCPREAISNYEKYAPDVQIYPAGTFPLLAAVLVGHCYAMNGQVTQGMGMLDAMQLQCQKRGDMFTAAYAVFSKGSILTYTGRVEEALLLMEPWVEKLKAGYNTCWAWPWGELEVATCYYLKEDHERARMHLQGFFKASTQLDIKARFYPYLFEICLGMKEGKFAPVEGLSLEEEIKESIAGENILMKGVAYRYKAILQMQEGAPFEEIVRSLDKSLDFLMQSGHKFELAKSEFELARQYAFQGNRDKAKEIALHGSNLFFYLDGNFIPDDIRNLMQGTSSDKDLLCEILKISQKISTIRDNRELVQAIISKANQVTGAERGAIFLLEDGGLRLRASKNLTLEEVNDVAFNSSREMMMEAVGTRKGLIRGANSSSQKGLNSEGMCSRICVPMILKNKVVGVLYNDNRLFKSTFEEKDINILAYFAAQAAIALDNAIKYEEIQNLSEKLRQENLYYVEELAQSHNFDDIIGESTAIYSVLKKIEQVANTNSTVLISGETGVGKEIVARAIHQHSDRQDKPFIRVFCNALPDTLIPSELFGHEKGAFTGATHRRIGKFELADGGTLFLDEIGDLPMDIQTRLLIVLQSKKFERVGGNDLIHSDFRLVVATNRDLEKELKMKRFRPDLYYRINVFPIYVPPLRERKEDISLLAQHFLKLYAAKMGKRVSMISQKSMNKLIQHEWPGNVRELENIIERGVILSTGTELQIPELDAAAESFASDRETSNTTLEQIEYQHILKCLQRTGGKIRGPGGAAEVLGIHPSTLDFRIKKLGIQKPGRN